MCYSNTQMEPEDILKTDVEAFSTLKDVLGISDQQPALSLRPDQGDYISISNIKSVMLDLLEKHLGEHPNPIIILEGLGKGVEVYFDSSIARNTKLYAMLIKEIRNAYMTLQLTQLSDWGDLQDTLVDDLMLNNMAEDFEIWDEQILDIIAEADTLHAKLSLCRLLVNKSFMMFSLEALKYEQEDWCLADQIDLSLDNIDYTKKAIEIWKSRQH